MVASLEALSQPLILQSLGQQHAQQQQQIMSLQEQLAGQQQRVSDLQEQLAASRAQAAAEAAELRVRLQALEGRLLQMLP